jgi:signal transduction histidine kinase
MKPSCEASGKVDWSKELRTAQEDSPSLVLAVFAPSGEMIAANCGMRRILATIEGDQLPPCDCFVNPAFQHIATAALKDGIAFEGLMTLGNRRDPGVALQGRVYRKADELLVVGHYDVMEFAWLNNELAQSNREVNTLQRALIQEKHKLADANEHLKVLDDQKNRFLGIAAHDLRSPLAVIESAAEAISQDTGMAADERGELLEMVTRNCRNMRRLLTDLLDISKIEQGKLEIHRCQVNLREFISTVVQLNRRISEGKGISLAVEVPEEPSEVNLDPDRIEQVLNNLIGNAIKFSHGGTTIRLEVSAENTGLRFVVSDEGLGIPTEEIPKLFREFQQTSTEATAGEHGTGLGLAICKRIVTLHGGSIGVESEVGRGSRFWFELPTTPIGQET